MKRILLIFTILLLTKSCGSKKDEYFVAMKNNLEAEHKITQIFSKRNIPLSEILAQAKIEKHQIDRTKFVLIDSLTFRLKIELNKYIHKLNKNKKHSDDIKFYNATLNFLRYVKELEEKIRPFLESIKDTIRKNEEELSIPVKEKALKAKYEINKWRKAEAEFYRKYDISQKEVDSITQLIE